MDIIFGKQETASEFFFNKSSNLNDNTSILFKQKEYEPEYIKIISFGTDDFYDPGYGSISYTQTSSTLTILPAQIGFGSEFYIATVNPFNLQNVYDKLYIKIERAGSIPPGTFSIEFFDPDYNTNYIYDFVIGNNMPLNVPTFIPLTINIPGADYGANIPLIRFVSTTAGGYSLNSNLILYGFYAL